MLDELPLSTKLTIVSEWHRRSETGEFAFNTKHRETFAALVEQCRREAIALETGSTHPVPAAIYVPDEFRPHGCLDDMAIEGGGNVLRLIFSSAVPKGGAR